MPRTQGNQQLPPLSRQLRDRLGEQLVLNSRRTAGGHDVWTGRTNPRGYGYLTLSFRGRHYVLRAHRAAYAVWRGRWPKPGDDVHHKCGNPSCVNPQHLQAISAEKHTKVPRGAPGWKNQYSEGSTYKPAPWKKTAGKA